MLRPDGPLRTKRVLVTAGPTYEDLDPVRYVGNRSSGRMGFALADEAMRRGAEVTLIAGPTAVEPPAVQEVVRVRTGVTDGAMTGVVGGELKEGDRVVTGITEPGASGTTQTAANPLLPFGRRGGGAGGNRGGGAGAAGGARGGAGR